jgi:hypothetical protein
MVELRLYTAVAAVQFCHEVPSLFGVWRSLVAHLVWDQGVQGSNPCTPTIVLLTETHIGVRPDC